MKRAVCALLLAALCFVPAGNSMAETADKPDDSITALATVEFSGEARETSPTDSSVLLPPNLNCDPQMLIPMESDCDPRFIIEPFTMNTTR